MTWGHPFEVDILRIPSDKKSYPYHSHRAQWEYFHVIPEFSQVSPEGKLGDMERGNAFPFKIGDAYRIIYNSDLNLPLMPMLTIQLERDVTIQIVARDRCVRPANQLIRSEKMDHYNGEE
ncbi:hypothetical protein N9B94_00515 [Verrucomicrobia bacterium]|nr:hypothetical protein [Verrucomicrobiota bacterium]